MKIDTQFVGMTALQRLAQDVRCSPRLRRRLATGLCGLIFARANILGVTGPFGASVTAGVPMEDTVAVCIGAVLGYLLAPNPSEQLGFALLCLLCAAAKLLAGQRWWQQRQWAGWAAAGLSVLLVGLPVCFLTAASPSDWMLLASQAVLASAAAWFVSALFVAGSPAPARRGRVADASLMVCLCILAGGLAGLKLAGVSVGCVASVLLAVGAGYALGGSVGAAVGASAGLAVAFVSGDFGVSVALYALGGMFAGIFRPLGRMGSAVSFVLCSGFVMLSTGRQMPLSSFVEVTLGTMAFIALPERAFSRLSRAFAPAGEETAALCRSISQRLRQAETALAEIGEATRKVAGRLEEKAAPEQMSLPEAVAAQVCRHCPKNTLCWAQCYGETQGVIAGLLDRARRDMLPDGSGLPEWFLQRCGQSGALAEAADRVYHSYASRRAAHGRAVRVRSIVTDQFDGMAMFLAGLESHLSGNIPAGPVTVSRIREAFSRWGTEPLSLVCLLVRGRRLEVEAHLPAEAARRTDLKQLARLVGEATNRSFALPELVGEGLEVRVLLSERNRYKLQVQADQTSQKEGTVCGDTWRSFSAPDGRCHVILSDGMGCGGGAALDSAMSVSLLSRLVQAGADYDSALRMVNSALLVKSGEESLATVDVSAVDLYTGRVDFYKAGAVPTVVRRGTKGGSVEAVSTPAGILNGVGFAHSSLTLQEGDWLVMMSDGATASGVDWVTREVEDYTGSDPGELARRLARAARLRRTDGRSDDITVICALMEAEHY